MAIFPIRHFRLEQFLPILGIDVISNLTEIFVRLGNRCTDHSGFAAVGDCGNWQNGSGSCVAGIL